jgi:hypothetical protein
MDLTATMTTPRLNTLTAGPMLRLMLAPTLVIRFVRELTDDAAGFGGLRTRVVELQFLYELSARLPLAAREVWSDEFESLQAFTDAVESLPEWKFVVEEGPPTGELLEDEERAESVG